MSRKTVLVLVLVVAGLAWWGGTALATHSDPDVVHLCVRPSRTVKLVTDPVSCTSPNTLVDVGSSAAQTDLEARVAALETLLAGVTRDEFGNLTFPSDVIAIGSVSAANNVIAGNTVTAFNDVSAIGSVRAANNVIAGNNVTARNNVSADNNVTARNNVSADNDVDGIGDFIDAGVTLNVP